MKRWTLALAVVYFSLMATAVTFPGIIPFNTIRPLIFGLPFAFAWVLGWVAGAIFIFFLLYRAYDT